jgi:hypothetical protein
MSLFPVKRWLGIDGVDLAIQAGVTICLAALMTAVGDVHTVKPALFFGAVSLGILAIRREVAKYRGELRSSEVSGSYSLDLEQRVADLETAQHRVFELEERLDFAERLLSQQRQPERLP